MTISFKTWWERLDLNQYTFSLLENCYTFEVTLTSGYGVEVQENLEEIVLLFAYSPIIKEN